MANLKAIAREALPAVRQQYRDILAENGYDPDDEDSVPDTFDHDVYLYVAANGDWTIDGASYFTRFHAYAHAGVYTYPSVEALYDELRRSADDY